MMMMWWRKEEEKTPEKQKGGRRRPRGKNKSSGLTAGCIDEQAMHLAETISGIEVSFPTDQHSARNGELKVAPLPAALQNTGVISLAKQLLQRKKIYRTQFCVSNWPVLEEQDDKLLSPSEFTTPRKHRVPLFGSASKENKLLFDDVLFLLRGHESKSEACCIEAELALLNAEIEALEKDRVDLKSLRIPSSPGQKAAQVDWEIHRLLMERKLTPLQRSKLQELRGTCLTVSLHNPRALETFSMKCGIKASSLKTRGKRKPFGFDVVQIRPANCRDGGAAAAIQHITLMKTSSADSAFLISRDFSKSYNYGHLPDRLYRRMKDNGMDPHHFASDIVYLSTGPLGCYYTEFRNGEKYWGSAVEDEDFHNICSEWNIYRVVFGAASALEDAEGHKYFTNSWIILGRDGRAAWKNLPARLHNKLESRMANEAAPSEVALGSGNSYFVRFLDGTVDYCLPTSIAQVCENIEKQGATITSMSLHPELSHDFVIRSTAAVTG